MNVVTPEGMSLPKDTLQLSHAYFRRDRDDRLAEPAMSLVVVEPLVPEHPAPQRRRTEGQFPHDDGIRPAELLRHAASEDGDHVRPGEDGAGRKVGRLQDALRARAPGRKRGV